VGAQGSFTQLAATGISPDAAAWATLSYQIVAGAATNDTMLFDDTEFYVLDDDINVAAGDVLIDKNGIAITNGKISVTNAGSTVIIDGTSDMFKIAATGTQSLNVGASSGETAVSVTLTGLGTYTTCPAYLAVETADTTSQTSNRHSGQFRFNNGGFIASVSGGATTFQVVASSTVFNTGITLTGASSGNAVVTLWANNQSANAYANSGNRYWVLQEVAL
jgi:hypothetical protein